MEKSKSITNEHTRVLVSDSLCLFMGRLCNSYDGDFANYLNQTPMNESINMGFDYSALKAVFSNNSTVSLMDAIKINWANSTEMGFKSLCVCLKDYLKREEPSLNIWDIGEILKDDSINKSQKESSKEEKPKQEVPKKQQPQKKEVEKAAAIDSTPTKHDLWMFELGRRQALGENYQGPLNPQQQQMILQQDSQTESPITSPQDKSNLSPKLITQKEMISCIKEFTSQFPAIYGEKFIKEIMEKDSCTLKGHGHDYIKLYQACHGVDAVSDNQLTDRIILEIDWIYSYKEFMADIGELFVEYTLKHMPSSEQFMKNDD